MSNSKISPPFGSFAAVASVSPRRHLQSGVRWRVHDYDVWSGGPGRSRYRGEINAYDYAAAPQVAYNIFQPRTDGPLTTGRGVPGLISGHSFDDFSGPFISTISTGNRGRAPDNYWRVNIPWRDMQIFTRPLFAFLSPAQLSLRGKIEGFRQEEIVAAEGRELSA
ncbi:unnamed protein product, partial [Iphiclides podalirius]